MAACAKYYTFKTSNIAQAYKWIAYELTINVQNQMSYG